MKGVSKIQKIKLEEAVKYYIENNINITACAKKFNCDRHALSRWLKKQGQKINPNGKQKINSHIFSTIDSEEKAYWLGFLYADGSVYGKNIVSLELAIKDRKHLEKFNSFLSKSLPLRDNSYRSRCVFQDSKIYKDLVNLGVIPNKSLILTFPDYNKVPKTLMKHFIRGYVDGDGSVYVSSNNIYCSVLGTKEFLNSLVKEINLPKRNLYKNNKNNDSNCWFFQYSGKNAIKFIKYMYEDCNVLLERKYNKYLEYEQKRKTRTATNCN